MKRPTGFFLLTLLAAMLAAMVVYSTLKQKQAELEKARAGLTPIVVAAHDLTVGTRLDANAVKLAGWPRDSVPPGAILDPHAAVGRITKTDFVQNEPLVTSRVISPEETSGVLPLMIPKELRAISVAVDEVADMAGFILPYTRVDVVLMAANRAKIILENIQVLAVAQTLQRKDEPQPERIVTLLVTPEEAERVALAEGQGKLHLALRSYGDNDLVATTGSDMDKLMAAFSPGVPPPPPTQQAVPVHFHWPKKRIPRPERVEVLRNGHISELVRIVRGHMSTAPQLASAEPQADQAPAAAAEDVDAGADSTGMTVGGDNDSGSGQGGGAGSSVGIGTP